MTVIPNNIPFFSGILQRTLLFADFSEFNFDKQSKKAKAIKKMCRKIVIKLTLCC